MKGENDAILPWLFHKKVTLALIDQQETPNYRENIVMSFTADPTKKNFARPVTYNPNPNLIQVGVFMNLYRTLN